MPGMIVALDRVALEAMQILLRSSWPGNTEQLWQVLRRVVQPRRTGSIRPACRKIHEYGIVTRGA